MHFETKIDLTKKETTHLRNFINRYNDMLKANAYTDDLRVFVLIDNKETEITVYVCGSAKVIDITPYNEYGIMLEINKAIEELY